MSQSQSEPPKLNDVNLPSWEDFRELNNEESLKVIAYHQATSAACLEHLARSLDHLGAAGALTTQPPANEQAQSVEPPKTEIPTAAEDGHIILPDGRSVPAEVVRALTEYNEGVWPGALLPEARAAIAHVVIRTIEGNQEPVLRTNYPFCLEPNPGGHSYESPCVLRADHSGKHRDNDDGVW